MLTPKFVAQVARFVQDGLKSSLRMSNRSEVVGVMREGAHSLKG